MAPLPDRVLPRERRSEEQGLEFLGERILAVPDFEDLLTGVRFARSEKDKADAEKLYQDWN